MAVGSLRARRLAVVNYKANSIVESIWIWWEAQDRFFSPRLKNSNARSINREVAASISKSFSTSVRRTRRANKGTRRESVSSSAEQLFQPINFDLELRAATEGRRTLMAEGSEFLGVALQRLRIVLDDQPHARELFSQPGRLRPPDCRLAPRTRGSSCHWGWRKRSYRRDGAFAIGQRPFSGFFRRSPRATRGPTVRFTPSKRRTFHGGPSILVVSLGVIGCDGAESRLKNPVGFTPREGSIPSSGTIQAQH
jgi:hypothetical protein